LLAPQPRDHGAARHLALVLAPGSVHPLARARTTGRGGGVTPRFPVYEKLPVTGDLTALLDLRAPHPGARVVRNVNAYIAAASRLFPHG
jgi:hypothetical protein